MFCKNCGSKLEPNAAFCPSCGTKTEPSVEATPVAPEGVNPQQPNTSTPAPGPVMPDAPETPLPETQAAPMGVQESVSQAPATPVINQMPVNPTVPNPGVQPAMPQGTPVPQQQVAPQKSGMSPGIIILIVVLAVVAAVLAFLLIGSKVKSGLSGNNNTTSSVEKTNSANTTTTTKMTTKPTTTKGIVSTSDSVTITGIKFNVPSGFEYEKQDDDVVFVNESESSTFIFSAIPNGECNETNFKNVVESYKEKGINVVSTDSAEHKGRKYYLMAVEIDNMKLIFGYTNIKNIGVAAAALEYTSDEDIIETTFDAINYVVDSAKSSSVFSPNENETIDITTFDFSKLKN